MEIWGNESHPPPVPLLCPLCPAPTTAFPSRGLHPSKAPWASSSSYFAAGREHSLEMASCLTSHAITSNSTLAFRAAWRW